MLGSSFYNPGHITMVVGGMPSLDYYYYYYYYYLQFSRLLYLGEVLLNLTRTARFLRMSLAKETGPRSQK